jgi:cytochrome b
MSTDPIQRWLMSWLQQCLLRRAPQDDPLSYSALQWSIAGYALLDLLQAGAGSDWSVAVGMTVLDILVMVLFVWAVLLLGRKSARFGQTLTALAGTGVVLSLLALPLILLATRAQGAGDPAAVVVLGWLLLLFWSIAVQAHIYRHALSTGYGTGLLLAGLHTVLIITLLEAVFAPTAG